MATKTIWKNSSTTEAQRLIYAAHNIVNNFYRINGFYLTSPKPQKQPGNYAVVFPKLDFKQIPRFWSRVGKIDIENNPDPYNKSLVKEVATLLERSGFQSCQLAEVQKVWTQAEATILAKISSFFPIPKLINKIYVYPTSFGTSCSFTLANKFPTDIHIFLRFDQDIYAICETIFTSLTRHMVENELGGLWSESELLADWLVLKSSLNPILKKYCPATTFTGTIRDTRQSLSLGKKNESESIYTALGLPPLKTTCSSKNGNISLAGHQIKNLTPKEKLFLSALISKRNYMLTVDEIVNLLYSNSANFSLYALAKFIQRLRNKLEENGISGSYIQTIRGKGYYLTS